MLTASGGPSSRRKNIARQYVNERQRWSRSTELGFANSSHNPFGVRFIFALVGGLKYVEHSCSKVAVASSSHMAFLKRKTILRLLGCSVESLIHAFRNRAELYEEGASAESIMRRTLA